MPRNFDITIDAAQLSDLTYIDHLQAKNAEALSFYPKVVFEREIPNGRVLLARVNADPAGYLYFGAFGPVVKVHQACIQYDLRGQLYGAELIRFFENMCQAAGVLSCKLRCGSDIAANGFWASMGFYCQSVTAGGVRRMRDINEWRKDFANQLFITSEAASSKEANASIWRKNKGNAGSQFIRGSRLKEYREEVLRRASAGIEVENAKSKA